MMFSATLRTPSLILVRSHGIFSAFLILSSIFCVRDAHLQYEEDVVS